VGIALIVVVRMFLQQQEATQKLQMEHQAAAFGRFEAKLDEIETRHAKDEQGRHDQLKQIIDRMLVSQERLSDRLAELRSALDALASSTKGHEAAIASLQGKLLEYQALLTELRETRRRSGSRGDVP
jgi:chromosome segregation ATPase